MTEIGWVVVTFVALLGGVALGFWLNRLAVKSDLTRLEGLASDVTRLQVELASARDAATRAEGEAATAKALQERQATEVGELHDALSASETRQNQLTQRLEEAVRENLTLMGDKRELQRTLEEREQAHQGRLEAVIQARDQLSDHFKSLAGDALKSSTEQLMAGAKEVLDRFKESADTDLGKRKDEIERLVKPIEEQLKSLDETQQQMERSRHQTIGEIREQLEAMNRQGQKLQLETSKLTTALKGSGSAGNLGELMLESLLERSGLEQNLHYRKQETLTDGDSNQRPDFTIVMPGAKEIYIDSKFPTSYFNQALEDIDDATRKQRLVVFAAKLADHVKSLSKRAYDRREQSADFTILFLGSDAMYQAAVQTRPSLLDDAHDQNVIIATPSSLFAILKSVAYAWRQEKIAENALAIRDQGTRLYDTLCTLTEHYAKLGKALGQAGEHYNNFGRSLERNTVTAAKNLQALGIASKKEVVDPVDVEFVPHILSKPELMRKALVPADQMALLEPETDSKPT